MLESFTTGRDGGVDFRYAHSGRTTVVQCKHYLGTGLSGLMANLKKEAAKVARLTPHRYILVTSVGLTPANKAAIQLLFGSTLAEADVLGPDDLNNLLGLHPKVEQRHFKLWLSSRAVLDRVIHNASIVQSEFEVERIHRDIRRYVQSSAYPRAMEMLGRDHVAIISGAPGVGKTSLAKMLLYAHLEQGFEPISILTDFSAARERYQRGAKQIFYFDDFIGATFLGERATAFTRNEDRAILDFMEMVRVSPTARLVMTTRQHILNQAINASERLKHSRIVDSNCVLEIRDYSAGQRAEILYNHIYFSDLPEAYRAELLAGRFYREVIHHTKFNPRLVEWLSTFQRVKETPSQGYQAFVRRLLANPDEIWRHAYEEQISNAARSVLLALYSHGGKCGPALLESAFRSLHELRSARYGFETAPSDWRRALRELGGALIRPGTEIEFVDPSVLDMLNTVVRNDTLNALDMIAGAKRFQQFRRVWTFALSPEGQSVLDHLVADLSCVTEAIERLLVVPNKVPVKGGFAYIDDSMELRLATMVQAAGVLKSAKFARFVATSLETLIANWVTEAPDLDDGLALLARVGADARVLKSSGEDVRRRIVRALVAEASTGCASDQLRELLNALSTEEIDEELEDLLFAAAEAYRSSYFGDELRNCKSSGDFENLQEDLKLIADRTNIDFELTQLEIRDAWSEFEDYQAAAEDRAYEHWKDQRYERRESDRAVDDMFDSLRKPS